MDVDIHIEMTDTEHGKSNIRGNTKITSSPFESLNVKRITEESGDKLRPAGHVSPTISEKIKLLTSRFDNRSSPGREFDHGVGKPATWTC